MQGHDGPLESNLQLLTKINASYLPQVLFAVFDSVQGFVIITVHCAMRREVSPSRRPPPAGPP